MPLIPLPQHQYTSSTDIASISTLFEASYSTTLKPSQIQVLTSFLQQDPLAVHSLGLSPSLWLCILDRNPSLAYELLKLKRLSLEFYDYFSKLNSLSVSLTWIECIYLLAPSLDKQDLYQAVSKKLSDSLNETDHHKIVLMVKLIQSLTALFPEFSHDLKPELESFCINFAKIKQVSSLYKELNQTYSLSI